MNILACHVINFGKLHDLNMSFTEGLNILNERNGWGKSTLAAFIKVMLYGLENDGKKDALLSERKRYAPWKGGTFGGSLSFETDGKSYILYRTFGTKAAEDTFEIRDLSTNLLSTDYSEKIGEELFKINSESFERTVFIRQNESEFVKTTDDINAKLGNITDAMDLNRFESIDERIKNELNALSATRKTGEIYKLKDEATHLKSLLLEDAGLDNMGADIRNRLSAARASLKECEAEAKDLNELRERVSAAEKRRAEKKTYEGILAEFKEKEALASEASALLNYKGVGDVSEEIGLIMDKSGRLADLQRSQASFELSAEDRAKLSEYESRFKNQAETVERVETAQKNIIAVASKRSEIAAKEKLLGDIEEDCFDAKRHKKFIGIYLLLAILLLFAGAALAVCFILKLGNIALLYGAIGNGVLSLCLFIVFFVRNGKATRELDVKEKYALKVSEEVSLLEAEISDMEKSTEALLTEHGMLYDETTVGNDLKELYRQCYDYGKLVEKRDKFTEFDRTEECEKLNSEIASIFLDFGVSVENSDYSAALQGIIRRHDNYKSAENLLKDVKARKEAFEREHDVSLLSAEGTETTLTLEDIKAKQEDLDRRTNELKEAINIDLRQLSALDEREEVRRDNQDKLSETEALISEKSKHAEILEGVKTYLSKARENITARYTGPLLSGFSKYYKMITGDEADSYRMDANTELTVSEEGIQHSVKFLSSGYKDLIGVCMRLAIVDAMYRDEKPTLILDDPFVNLDENNLEGGMRLLREVSKEYRIIMFTCRDNHIL